MDRQWILLSKNEESKYEQSGPFGTQSLKWMLRENKISNHDYVWSEGFANWKPLDEVDEFIEKQGEQLTFDFIESEDSVEHISTVSPPQSEDNLKNDIVVSNLEPAKFVLSHSENADPQYVKKPRRYQFVILSLVMLSVSAVLLKYSSRVSNFLKADVIRQASNQRIGQDDMDLSEVGPFRTVSYDLDKEDGRIEFIGRFLTGDLVKEKIELQIQSVPGEILKEAEFKKKITISGQSDSSADSFYVTLRELNAPVGMYTFTATRAGGADRVVGRIFIGSNDAEFRAQLEAHNEHLKKIKDEENAKVQAVVVAVEKKLADLRTHTQKAHVDRNYLDSWLASNREILSKEIKDLKGSVSYHKVLIDEMAQVEGQSLNYVQNLKRVLNTVKSPAARKRMVMQDATPAKLYGKWIDIKTQIQKTQAERPVSN